MIITVKSDFILSISAQNHIHQSVPLDMKLHLLLGLGFSICMVCWFIWAMCSLIPHRGLLGIPRRCVKQWWSLSQHAARPRHGWLLSWCLLLPMLCILWSKVHFSYRRIISQLSWEWQQLIWSWNRHQKPETSWSGLQKWLGILLKPRTWRRAGCCLLIFIFSQQNMTWQKNY